MPTLTLRLADGTVRTVGLIKRITTVGSSPDNDVVVADPSVPAAALHLQIAGDRCNVVALDDAFFFNGKKKNEAILREGDVIGIGAAELLLGAEAPAGTSAQSAASSEAMEAFRKLHAFSERLLGPYEIERVLENLMDAVIEVTEADKGFLILLEGNDLQVKVARNLARENIEDALERVSDSIVAKALREKRPIIVSDALNDQEFASAASVVNLKLCSVMCAPLVERGNVFGLIYVGNDKVAHLFEEHSLETLTIFAAQASLLLRNALLVNELQLDNKELRRRLEEARYGDLLGSCAAMREIYRKIDKVAGTDISILISGETGTGKEMLAREIHRRSARADGPFVAVNCGAIPENLLESELFGHVKGAFTGAVANRQGRFQAASGGTLFLDEIGEMPVHLQVKILRALQERTVVRVGENRPEAVDIRVVAATNRNLEEEIAKGAFREDLYYRLNVVELGLPPLRERGDDVVVLGRYFLAQAAREYGARVRGFTPNATVAMKKYAWPGNVRELENRVRKAVVLADKALVSAEDLDLRPENLDPILPLQAAREEFQKRYINEVLERNNGNRTKTARDLGVDPRTIFRHLEAERSGDDP